MQNYSKSQLNTDDPDYNLLSPPSTTPILPFMRRQKVRAVTPPVRSSMQSDKSKLPASAAYWLGILMAILLVGLLPLALGQAGPSVIVAEAAPKATVTVVATATPVSTPAPVAVCISGAVLKPGLYYFAAGTRIGDALAHAGGLTTDANAAAINQAALLQDGTLIYIPALSTDASQPPAGVSGVPVVADSPTDAGALINLNTATAAELESLPGIGPSKAQAIIANRPFARVEALDNVPGIGPATLKQLRSLVTVQ